MDSPTIRNLHTCKGCGRTLWGDAGGVSRSVVTTAPHDERACFALVGVS